MMDKLKILIVEDDKSLLNLYDLAIPDDIFEKSLAENGETAIEMYRWWKPDIVLLDMLLPKISGETVLKEIRESFNDKTTAIIVSSIIDEKSEIDSWKIDSWKMLGIQGYKVKPFDYRTIAGEIIEGYERINPVVAKIALIHLRDLKKRKWNL